MVTTDRQTQLARFLKRIAPTSGELESLAPGGAVEDWLESAGTLRSAGAPAPGAPAAGASPPASPEELDTARRAVDKLTRDEPLDERETFALEAIVVPQGRPVVDIVGGRYLPPGAPWQELDAAVHRQVLEPAILSIGRVEIPDHPSLPYAGTGFLVGDGLLMTNRHVAELFVLGLGVRKLAFRAGLEKAGVDFVREVRHPEPSTLFEVGRIVMVHPYWDMALLEVTGVDATRRPLELDPVHPDDMLDRDVVVIGYPARDPRNDLALQNRIFGGVYEVKRFQPGCARGVRQTRSFGKTVAALSHDSSTLGGNSGSAVLDARTGRVLGLHFGGVYLDSNFAVPAYELSRDARIVAAGVRFAATSATGPTPWDSYWRSLEGAEVPSAPPAPVAPAAAEVSFTIPVHVTVRLGAPALAQPTSPSGTAALATRPARRAGAIDVEDARSRARACAARKYFDAEQDGRDVRAYYGELASGSAPAFDLLARLLKATHRERPAYAPTKWVYPWVDRQPDGRIRSLYSAAGKTFSFEELVQADLAVEAAREERLAELPVEALGEEALEAIEAALPFNCEHVVPQSWFGKREPMRGDLHHLFACESSCNSFRGNRAYHEFREEAVRTDCGRSGKNEFEPGAGRGAVARATFYFLVRYPDLVGSPAELPADRLDILRRWHEEDPPAEWERHRNQAIFEIQGNRNPFIDFPRWAAEVELAQGLGRRTGRTPSEVPVLERT